jgi:hypothetical protein
MVNSTSLSSGNPDKSSGNTFRNSQTTGIETRLGEASALATTGEAKSEGIRRDILSLEEEVVTQQLSA